MVFLRKRPTSIGGAVGEAQLPDSCCTPSRFVSMKLEPNMGMRRGPSYGFLNLPFFFEP